MKLTAILIFAFCLHVSAKTEGQVITLSVKNKPLEQVLTEIKKQSGFSFIYGKELVSKADPVSINVKDEPLASVLDLIFQNQKLTYKIADNYVVISPKSTAVFQPADNKKDTTSTNLLNIHGKVVDENGKPVPGVTVTVKGTKKQTITDENGEFTIPGVETNAVLAFSTVNMEPFEIRVDGKTEIFAKLKTKTSELDEVQIIAYGQTTKRLQTGNVSTIKGEDVRKQPVNNPLLALEGKVPGVFVTQNSGVAGGGITIRIQGQNSLARGNDPLYVIDGVPYISQLLPDLSGPTGGIFGSNGNTNPYNDVGGGNPLFYINPDDIESVEILKDADATSIYGSRAAAGAILITTKKGKAGKTKVDFTLQNGWGKVTRFLKLLNTEQYLELRHEAKENDHASSLPTDYDINGVWDSTRYTDWQKVLIGGTAHISDAHISVSAGNSNTQFLIEPSYHRETTVFPGNFKDEKGSVHFNINNVSTNQKFKIQLSGNYLVDDNHLLTQDLTSVSVKIAPDAPPLIKTDGTLNWQPLADETSTWYNPLAYLEGKYRKKVNSLISNAQTSFLILPGLEIKSNFGYTNLQSTEVQINPLLINAPELRAFSPRTSAYANSNINTWIAEPQLTFSHSIGAGFLNILFGSTFQQTTSSMQQFTASGFNSDIVMEDIRAAASVVVSQSIASRYNYNAFFGRVNYDWKNRYLVNIAGRIDGSSRFGFQNQFHNFGSIGLAWLFSSESFFKKIANVITYGKLRGSFGTTGNDQIGDYQFMNLYSTISVPTPYQGATGSTPNGFPNAYLEWEETKKLQGGVDLGFLKDRIFLTLNYYRNKSSNQLQGYSLPFFTGFGTIQENLPATVLNSGLELSVNSTLKVRRDLIWRLGLNITIPHNKLIAYPSLENSSYSNLYVIGQPIPKSRAFHFAGVDNTTGLFTFTDSKGNLTSSPTFPNDLSVLEIATPKLYGGLENTFQYKGFELDILFQFVKQNGFNYKLGNFPGRFFSFNNGTVLANQPTSVLDRWKQPGDNSFFQRASSTYPINILLPYVYGTLSDAAFSDASFIRLKNASVSWTIPERVRKVVHLQNAKVFLLGQNLVTITKYVGLDPETQSTQNLPPLKVYTVGVQIGF